MTQSVHVAIPCSRFRLGQWAVGGALLGALPLSLDRMLAPGRPQ